jgi:hypothetical protein
VDSAGTSRGRAFQPRDLTGRSAVAGLFRDRDDAERALYDLHDAGFHADDVGLAARNPGGEAQLAGESGSHAGSGAVSGAVGGGLLGASLGFLVGVGALVVPGIGPALAGGALASAFGGAAGATLAGAGLGAAAGGLAGALIGMGIPEEEARHFDAGFRTGAVLITVRAGERAMEALAILERHSADTGPGSLGAAGTATAAATGATIAAATGSEQVAAAARDPGATLVGSEATATVSGRVDDYTPPHSAYTLGDAVTSAPAGGSRVAGSAGERADRPAPPAHDGEAEGDPAQDTGAAEVAGGTVAGAAAGVIAGSLLGGPVGTIVGGALGAVGGGAAGAAAHRHEDHEHHKVDERHIADARHRPSVDGEEPPAADQRRDGG